MATGKRAGKGIKNRNLSDTAGIRPYKLDLAYATEAAYLAAKSIEGVNSSSAEEGDFFYDSTVNALKVHNGAAWETVAGATTKRIGIPLDICKKDAAMITPLPAAGDATNFGLVDGITGAMHLVGSDADGTTITESCGLMVAVPDSYIAGQTLTLRVRAGLTTTVATGTSTVDVNAYILGDDDAISADLCTTAAQSINSLTLADKDFVIDDDVTGEVIGAGDVLQIKLTCATTDDGTGGAKLTKINELSLIVSA